jgi:hypothetical protein
MQARVSSVLRQGVTQNVYMPSGHVDIFRQILPDTHAIAGLSRSNVTNFIP